MRAIRCVVATAVAACVAGCVTSGGETVRFHAKPNQQTFIRDGDGVISSRGKNSVVSVRPATHLVGERPVFIVGIQNTSRQPLDFRVTDVVATQVVQGQPVAQLKVFTYDELVSEEKNAQVARAVLVAAVGGVNAGLAARQSGYAQYRADVQNAELATNVAVAGQQNLAALEQMAIKDNTIMPGEQYAGKLAMQGPVASDSGPKTYSLAIMVGPDRHDIQVVQGR